MRSRVEVVADVADDGTPVLVRLHADGALAVRRTGPATVHLVGTAAGPLDGDVVEVDVTVRPGARLGLEQVAATIALPGPGADPATWVTTVRVGTGGRLRCAPQPLVVSAGARLHTRTCVELAAGAGLDLTEQVVLGRFGEPGGDWSGRLVVNLDHLPVLRQTQSSALLAAGPVEPGAPPARALVSRLLIGPAGPDGTATPTSAVSGTAVACPLAGGGTLFTAFGPSLADTLRHLDGLLPSDG